MAVTAKFKVSRISGKPGDWAREVEMTPDYAQGRNAEWAAATPSGVIRLSIGNEKALEQFKEGAPVHVLFEFPTE